MVWKTKDVTDPILFQELSELIAWMQTEVHYLTQVGLVGHSVETLQLRHQLCVELCMVDDIGMTSDHLECASMMMKNIFL